MTSESKRQLRGELGGDLAALALLSDADAAALSRMIRSGHAAESAALVKAINQTVSKLPWPFRGPVRDIVFGGIR